MIDRDHPYFFLSKIFANEEARFYLSKYVYKEDSLLDHRKIITVSGSQLTAEWVDGLISSLSPDEELALHSRVDINKSSYHIPMIDFATHQLSARTVERLRYFLPKEVVMGLAFFDSGRSYHGYSLSLLSSKKWREFMGRLLLINPREGNAIIDSRWVGHRLIGGYCSLRWSNSTGVYIKVPNNVANVSTIGEKVLTPAYHDSIDQNEI